MKCSNAAFGEQNKMKRNISNGEWDEWGEEIFGRQLLTIREGILFGLEECAGRIGNPQQNDLF